MSEPFKAGDVISFENVGVYSKNFDGNKFSVGGPRTVGFFIDDPETKITVKGHGPVSLEEFLAMDCPAVKETTPYEGMPEDWEPRLWVKASIGYNYRAPSIYQITNRKQLLDEQTIDGLQRARISGPMDIEVRVAAWEMQGKTGLKLWVTEAYIPIVMSLLSEKYANLMDGDDDDED